MMVSELAWMVGGQQGEGIESTGEIFSIALNRLGYHLYGYRIFSSRIKGGHTSNTIRISTVPRLAVADTVDILVAFDQEAIDVCRSRLQPDGIIIADCDTVAVDSDDTRLCLLPLTKLAAAHGSLLMKNMVAIGATLALTGIDSNAAAAVIREIFAKKGESVVQGNLAALAAGAAALRESCPRLPAGLNLAPSTGKGRLFVSGNEMIALGALAGGCRFMSAYPITPASDIMEYLGRKLPEIGGIVVQTEDEIAACTMAIGAGHAGVRAITASSGPGLALMTEAIGLAGMTETPLVVIDCQRSGPSTGMPTRHEQSDLFAMLYASPGEIPKIVIAPESADAALYDTAEALNLAEEFQCPVIVLSDLQLSLAQRTVDPPDPGRITIRRGRLDTTPAAQPEESFARRFAITADGISPRLLPGTHNRVCHVTGLEHNENGLPSEHPGNRTAMTEKRLRKLAGLHFEEPLRIEAGAETADLLLIGFGSTYGAIREAAGRLTATGLTVHCVQIRLLHPFPADALQPLLDTAARVCVIEQNATGQLAGLLRMETGRRADCSVRKFDGTPLSAGEIVTAITEQRHEHR